VTHGLTVLVGSRNLKRGVAAAKEVGPDAHALQLDVTDHASVDAAAERVRKEFGRLDVLIQNAAISNTNKLPGQSVEEYVKTTRPSNVSLHCPGRSGRQDARLVRSHTAARSLRNRRQLFTIMQFDLWSS
jgi:NAD(P)-dependent dehydrogenase (short-subunit alcohol dehydrogenase family)